MGTGMTVIRKVVAEKVMPTLDSTCSRCLPAHINAGMMRQCQHSVHMDRDDSGNRWSTGRSHAYLGLHVRQMSASLNAHVAKTNMDSMWRHLHQSKNAEGDDKLLQAWIVAFTSSIIEPHLIEVHREASGLVFQSVCQAS